MFDFRLDPADIRFVGSNLQRPECVVALADGAVLASNRRAAVTVIKPDGMQFDLGHGLSMANTFAVGDDGLLSVVDLGAGNVVKLDSQGRPSVLLDQYDGKPLGMPNFILGGEVPGTAWLSISTTGPDGRAAISTRAPDGRILHLGPGGATCVADGLFFPNAMQIDPDHGYLYVVETTAGRVARAPLVGDDQLGALATFGPDGLFDGAYPDGLALDADGNVWIAELSRNAIYVLDQAGVLHEVFRDPTGQTLNKPTDLCFGGPDNDMVYIGSLKMDRLPVFQSPIPGLVTRARRMGTSLAIR